MGNFSKKFTSVLLSATTAVWLSGFSMLVPVAHAQSVADIQAQINALLTQIAALQAQLAAQAGGAAVSCSFTRALTVGVVGDDVKCLQQYLNGAGHKVAVSGVGSLGNETTYFGNLTKAAVASWQSANGVSPAVGYFGPISRAKYSSLVAGAPAPVTPGVPVVVPAGTGLTVTLAPDQPAGGLFGESFASREFTKLRFTASADGDVKVKAMTVERTGQGQDAVFSGVLYVDEDGLRQGPTKTFGSDHRLRLTEAFTVKAGQTRTLVLVGDSDSDQNDYNGQLVSLSLVGVDTESGAAVNATFPLTGATHTVNSTLAVGSLLLIRGAYDPGSGLTKEIGTTGYIFSGLRMEAGSNEDLLVKSIRWNNSGSAGVSDLANIKVNLDGVDYDTTVSSDGKYYSAKFGDGIKILKGLNKQVYIKGDVVGGSARTVDFDLFRYADIRATGLTYSYDILPAFNGTETTADNDDDGEFQNAEPRFDAYQAYIGAGTITAQNAPAVGAQNIAINLSSQPLGGLIIDVKGEDITVAGMNFDVAITKDAGDSLDTNDVTNITLVRDDGAVVAGPVDGVAGGNNTVRFTDTVTFKPGRVVYTLKGKLGTDFGTNDTVTASSTPSSDWTTVRGVTSGVTITPAPASAVTMSTMTVKAAALTVSLSPATQETSSASTTGQTVVAGTSTYLFTTYVLDASGSGEDIRVNSLKLRNTFSSSNTADDLTNCQLYDGSAVLNTGGNIVNPANSDTSVAEKSFNLDASLVIPKGTIRKLDIKCNLVSGANGSGVWQWGITDDDASITATGVTSGQTVDGSDSITGTEDGRQIAAATSGTLAFALDPSSPALKWAQAGSTDNTLAVFRFNATNEDISITSLGLQMATSTSAADTMASNTPSDLSKVTVWDGALKVGEAVFSATDYATATLAGVVVPKNGQKILTVKTDIASIYQNGPAKPGHLVIVNYDASSSSNCFGGVGTSCQRGATGVGMSSGVAIGSGGSDSSTNGARIAAAVPTVSKVALASTKFTNTTNQSLYKFKVSAPLGTNGVSLYKFNFSVSTNTSSVTELPDVDGGGVDPTFSNDFMVRNFKLYCYSDSGFTSPSCGSADNSGLLNFDGLGVMTGNAADIGPTATSTDTDDLVNQDDPELDFDVYFNPAAGTGSTREAIRLPAGESRYFLLKADVTGASSTPSITVRMNGDATFAGLNDSEEVNAGDGDLLPLYSADDWTTGRYIFATAAVQVDAWDDDGFIWSGNSTNSTQSINDYDWFNGYLVPGLSNTDIGDSETLTLQ